MNTITSDQFPPRIRREERFMHALLRLASAWNATLTLKSRSRFLSLLSMHHNFDALRRVPILHVAEALRMPLMKVSSRNWAMRDPERPRELSSLILDTKTNTWHRWSGKTRGGVDHGSTIDLVLHIRECSFREAVEFLSSRFL